MMSMMRVGTPTPTIIRRICTITSGPCASGVFIGLLLGMAIMTHSTPTCIGTTTTRSFMAIAPILAGVVSITRGIAHGDTICGVGTHGDRVLVWDGAINPTLMVAGDMVRATGMVTGTRMSRTVVPTGATEADLINLQGTHI